MTCDPMGCSPPGSSVRGILQAGMLEWVATSFSVSCVGRQILSHCATWEAGDSGEAGSIPGSGRSPRGGQGNPLQYSCPENSMDRVRKEADTTEQLNRNPHPRPRHRSPHVNLRSRRRPSGTVSGNRRGWEHDKKTLA